ncbi:MAG: septal ring lytic transglycosylase RlpA family protein [Alphaproteobacteria bacterium]
MRHFIAVSFLSFCLLLSGCSEIELASHFGKKLAGGGYSKGHYKIGSPYTIKGVRYYPAVDYDYDKRGVASWYGPGFHGKKTANGETYDQNELTAAHKTLPLPSIVRVTNLENGRSLIVRVNDRGPYAHGRIIDMSKRSAELLGFKNKGIAKVRVQVLEAESRMVAQAAQNGQDTRGMEVPMNKSSYKSPNVQMASTKPAPVNQPVSLTTQNKVTTPGHVKAGNFYPDSVVSEYPVNSKGVFVQTGAFSTREGAMRHASALDTFGRAQIHPVTVDNVTYYRVRFPTRNVPEADALLEGVMARGHNNARIIVD